MVHRCRFSEIDRFVCRALVRLLITLQWYRPLRGLYHASVYVLNIYLLLGKTRGKNKGRGNRREGRRGREGRSVAVATAAVAVVAVVVNGSLSFRNVNLLCVVPSLS